jgi:hypothetical protein
MLVSLDPATREGLAAPARRVVGVLLLCLSFVVLPTPGRANATPYPLIYNGVFYIHNNLTHSLCYTPGLSSTHRVWVADSMEYLDSVTNLHDVAHGTSCLSTTDIVWFVVNNDPGTPLGVIYCVSPGTFVALLTLVWVG